MGIVVSTLGAWEEQGAQVIKGLRLGQGVARATCQDDNEVVRHLFGKLSVLLQRDNAGLVLNRIPLHPDEGLTGDM